VAIEKPVYGGESLARVDGRVVLAPFVLPGERVRLRARNEKPGLIRAAPEEIIEPSAARIAPACPYFGRCGGCHYQHATYEWQLAAKRAILTEELWRQAKIRAPEEIAIISGEPWGYRNRVQLHVESGRIGYRMAGTHNLCAVDHCPISSPKVNETIGALNAMVKDRRWPNFLRSLEIFTDENKVQLNVRETTQPVARRFFDWCAETIPALVPGALDYCSQFRVSGNSFFQVNRFLLDTLVTSALAGAEGETALELYSGVGLFSLTLARQFQEVTAVESGAGAAGDLTFNVQRAALENLRVERNTAERFLASLEHAPDFVLLDPPRAGIGPEAVTQLARLKPRRVTIVACDPVTLARDLAGLTAAGFALESLVMADLFPQTFHLETIARLVMQ
jgi:23S rRNA (uracil1939-C5)-methyltransferase